MGCAHTLKTLVLLLIALLLSVCCVECNHRMPGIGRDLERSSSPIPLPGQEHLSFIGIKLTQKKKNDQNLVLVLSNVDVFISFLQVWQEVVLKYRAGKGVS